MGTVNVYTAERMQAIEDSAITGAQVDPDGDLTFIKHDGTEVPAGNIKGPQGDVGNAPPGDQNTAGILAVATSADVAAQTSDTKAVSPLGLASMAGRRYLGRKIYTADGTYTPSAGVRTVKVIAVGGGGAGGGGPAAAAGVHTDGGGGGAGAYAEVFYNIPDITTPVAISIGAGGSGAAGAAGVNGGTTTFGTYVSCQGGTGGAVGVSSALTIVSLGGTGGTPTVTGGFDGITFNGDYGSGSNGSDTLGHGGRGASTRFGSGGRDTYSGASGASVVGVAALGRGAGGGGSSTNQSGGASTGGAGMAGLVIVEEYV